MFIVIVEVVAPVLQLYVAKDESTFNPTLPPVQKVVGPVALIVAFEEFTTTARDAVAVQLPVLVIVTV